MHILAYMLPPKLPSTSMEPLIPPYHPLRARLLEAGYRVNLQEPGTRKLLINGTDHVRGFYLSPSLAEYFLTVDVSRVVCMLDIDSMVCELRSTGYRIVDRGEAVGLFKMLRLKLCPP